MVLSAFTVIAITGALALRTCQVPVQVPFFKDMSGSGGSPLENVAVTVPLTCGLPQSSTTRISTGVGHAAATLKPYDSEVKSGT